jgi:preprotein translocase subunit SecG
MWSLIAVVHVLVGLALIFIVLLQKGKGASMGAAFGGSSQTLFGSAGPGTFLSKLTTIAAVVFMGTSLTLAYMSSSPRSKSVMEGAGAPVRQEAPAGKPAMPTMPQAPAQPKAVPQQAAPAPAQQPAAPSK